MNYLAELLVLTRWVHIKHGVDALCLLTWLQIFKQWVKPNFIPDRKMMHGHLCATTCLERVRDRRKKSEDMIVVMMWQEERKIECIS